MTPDERDTRLERAMARHRHSGDGLIEVLHVAQQLYGSLSKPLLRDIARRLRLPPSRVLGVATFYHLFRFEPDRAHSAVVCLGTACYAAGGPELMSTLRAHADHETPTSVAGGWTIRAGHCVGSCGLAPIVICDGISLSRTTPAHLDEYLARLGDA